MTKDTRFPRAALIVNMRARRLLGELLAPTHRCGPPDPLRCLRCLRPRAGPRVMRPLTDLRNSTPIGGSRLPTARG